MKIIDTMFCAKEDMLQRGSMKELFGETWKEYYERLKECALYAEEVSFTLKDIDRSILIVNEDGENIFLKDGRIMQTCWRFHSCRIWEIEDEFDKETLSSWR